MNTLTIRINGVLSAFGPEPGCPCARCHDPDSRQRAHVSASLVVENGCGPIEHHLVDIGFGVGEQLCAENGPWPLTSVLLTHAHFDHVAGLDFLANSLQRAQVSGVVPTQVCPLPVFATPVTWEFAVERHFPYLPPQKLVHQPVTPGVGFTPGSYPGLRVTPIPVVHFKDSVVYVVEFWRNPEVLDQPADVTVGLCWDFLSFVSPEHSKADAGHEYVEGLDASHPLLRQLDLLIIETNTWHPRPETGHTSFADNLELMAQWQPKQTRLVHYSGWEDHLTAEHPIDPQNRDPALGPVNAADLQVAVAAQCPEHVHVGYAGETFSF